MPDVFVLVRGIGDIGSAVAHCLFRHGYRIVIHDEPRPATTRRGMAFTDAAFDGSAVLEGVRAVLAGDPDGVRRALVAQDAISVYVQPLKPLLATLKPEIVVDARMRKHSAPESQLGLAPLTIALGPGFTAGHHADVVIETSWDDLGRVITKGASLPLSGEPREISGHARDRYLYAPIDGVFRTQAGIGDLVHQGQDIAGIHHAGGMLTLAAPLDGVLRGLTRDGVPVTAGTKVLEIDPRGRVGEVTGINERPRRIADGVLAAVRSRQEIASK